MLYNAFKALYPYFYFEQNDGAGSGGGSGNNDDENNQNQNNGDDENNQNQNQNQNQENNSGNNNQKPKTFTQEQLDAIVSKRLKEEKDKQDRADKEKQGEFQKLYDDLKPKYEEFETKVTESQKTIEELEGILTSRLEETIKDWPDALKTKFPKDSGYKVKSDWVTDMTPIAAQLQGTRQNVNGEHGNNGKGNVSDKVLDQVMNRYALPDIPGVTQTK